MVLAAHTAPAQEVAYRPDSAAPAVVYRLGPVAYMLALAAVYTLGLETCSSPWGPPMTREARPGSRSAIDRSKLRILGRRRRCH